MKRGLRLFLLRWHRRLGVVAAVVVVMLVLTGIVLNHSAELALDQRPVRQAVLLERYGVELPSVVAYAVGGDTLALVGGNRLFLNEHEVAYCQAPLSAALQYGPGIVALCNDQLILLTPEGEVIERLDSAYGLPDAMTALGISGGVLWIAAGESFIQADLNSLDFADGKPPKDVNWAEAVPVEPALKSRLVETYLGNDVHWERLLLDLHSGRLFGQWGVYVVDVAAIILLLLALSGVWVWFTKPGRWARR